jgi:hypothetical protein
VKIKYLLAVAATATVAALGGSALPASATTGPDGFTILYADSGNVVHDCEVLGTDPSGYQAVVCLDINTGANSSGYWASGSVETMCDHGSAASIVACPYIVSDADFANAAQTYPTTASQSCSGNCPNGRWIIPIATFDYTGGHDCTESAGHDVWNVAFSDLTIGTPGGSYFDLYPGGSNDGENYSTGHYWVCP